MDTVQHPLPVSEPAPSREVYEHPLGERIRSFLRLEYMFERAYFELGCDSHWAARTTMKILIDIMALTDRSDVKQEIIKELERLSTTLENRSHNLNVDRVRLDDILARIRQFLGAMKVRAAPPGHELRYHEFLSSVRRRSSIPAGTCDFELPNLHFWLQKPTQQRSEDLLRWLSAFDLVRGAITLWLSLIRESGLSSEEVANDGFYQRSLDPASPCQLIRVVIDSDRLVFPEISAGKHRFTVRFMELENTEERPVQTTHDIPFQLSCCGL